MFQNVQEHHNTTTWFVCYKFKFIVYVHNCHLDEHLSIFWGQICDHSHYSKIFTFLATDCTVPRCPTLGNMLNEHVNTTAYKLTKGKRLNLWLHLLYKLWQQDLMHRTSRAHYALYMQLIKQCKQSSLQPQQTEPDSPVAIQMPYAQSKI